MNAFEELLAVLNESIDSVDAMIQNVEEAEKKECVKNDDDKDKKIENLLARIANLEARLKNADEDDNKEKAVENLAQKIVNLLRNANGGQVKNSGDKNVKNKGVRNTDKNEADAVENLAKRIANHLRNADKKEEEVENSDEDEEVENSDDDEETVENKNVRNKGLRNKGVRNDDKDDEESIANLAKRVANYLRNADKVDYKVDVGVEIDDDGTVKNKGVRNKVVRNKDVFNGDKEDDKDKAVTNAIGDILLDMVTTRQRNVNELIDMIVTNSDGLYARSELIGKPIPELQKLSNLLAKSSMPITNASRMNVQMDAGIQNSQATLDVPPILQEIS